MLTSSTSGLYPWNTIHTGLHTAALSAWEALRLQKYYGIHQQWLFEALLHFLWHWTFQLLSCISVVSPSFMRKEMERSPFVIFLTKTEDPRSCVLALKRTQQWKEQKWVVRGVMGMNNRNFSFSFISIFPSWLWGYRDLIHKPCLQVGSLLGKNNFTSHSQEVYKQTPSPLHQDKGKSKPDILLITAPMTLLLSCRMKGFPASVSLHFSYRQSTGEREDTREVSLKY